MTRLQALIVIVCVSLAVAACTQHAQARPGPSFTVEENPTATATELQPQRDESAFQLKNGDAPIFKELDEEDFEVEDEVDCTDMETCNERRFLTATIDYKNDGPNNPITDPPH